jgi:hypothetical protein
MTDLIGGLLLAAGVAGLFWAWASILLSVMPV